MYERLFFNDIHLRMKDQDWQISRKAFVKTLLLSGVALQLPWLQGCTDYEDPGQIHPLNSTQFKNLRSLQEILFPNDGNGPGALQVHADQYLVWVLNDPLMDQEEKDYIIKKLNKFNTICIKDHSKDFYKLDQKEKEDYVEKIADSKWGKKWISRLLTLIFEALLLDPVYNVNPEQIGWEWLEHNPGQPRADKTHKYPDILKISHEV